MRILQLIDSLNTGGAERMAVNIANHSASSGNESFLCTTREEGLLKSAVGANVNYLFLKKKSALDIKAIWKLKSYIKANNIDVIHAHATSFFTGALMKIFRPKTKLIWHDHYGNSEELSKRPYYFLRLCSIFFSTIICVNQILLKWNKEKLLTDKVMYIPNFVEVEVGDKIVRDIKGLKGKRLLCVANLRPQKDHLTLLRAFKMIREKYSDWTLHFVGHDFGDEYSEKVNMLIEELDIESSVYLYGSRDDVRSIMKYCDIGILSSLSEGLPLVLLEYGLSDMAVIATDVGDSNEIIESNNTGILIPPKNIIALKSAMISLIEDKQLCQNLAVRLKEKVLTKFSPDTIMKTIYLVYQGK